MTAHLKPEDSASMVLDALLRAGKRGLTLDELIDETDLTVSQVRRGLGFLRESMPDLEGVDGVYSYDPITYRYCVSYIPELVEAYELLRLRSEATRSYRILTGTVIPHARHAKTVQLRLLKRHLELVVGETDDILQPAG
ncbi:hypothetical protein [Streptomyces chattanoogensis]|uniref:hypothetical protein n=1 Tax=Streptomyces chattanoogensis TaxID=66876 RepID=UPI0036A72E84